MRFAEPNWLWIGAGACTFLLLAIVWSERRRASAIARFVAARHTISLTETVSHVRRLSKHALSVIGCACIFVALARPQWGYHFEERRREGLDLMFAVDTSKSMLAQDLRPSRLERAKLAVEDLLGKLPDDRVGLVAFAGDAFLQTPLTLDRVAFRQSLNALDTDLIPVPGTDLESALRVTEQAFGNEPDHRKILVLLSDGEDLAGSALSAARDAAAHGIRIYTIGIGTAQGALIPVHNERGAAELLRDPAGELVHSHLDEATLREMARITGGSYRALGQSGQGLESLYRDALAKLPKQTIKAQLAKVYHERFQWPLGLGIVLLLGEWLLNDRRKQRTRTRHAVVTALAALGCLASALPSGAHAEDRKPVETYNRASQEYAQGHFAAAAQDYRAASAARDLSLQERAYYDRGNALYRQGQAAGDNNVQLSMQRYKSAIASYESALALKADDADATFNRDFVRRKLKQLEQQQANKPEQPKPGEPPKQGQPKQDPQSKPGEQGSPGQKPKPGEQAKQDAQAKPPQPGAGQPGGSQNQQAKQEPTPQAKPGDAKPDAKSGQQPYAANAAQSGKQEPGGDPGKPAVPGGLTRREAAHLLDSLEGELQQLPSGYDATKPTRSPDDHARKDW